MLGLIYKDFINFKSYSKTLLIMAIVFLGVSISNGSPVIFISFFLIMSLTITLSTFSYDEVVDWNHYAMTLPIRRKDIVTQKYLFGYGLMLLIAVISTVISMIYGYYKYNSLWGGEGEIFVVVIMASLVSGVLAIVLPCVFKYGAEKARYIMMGVLVIPFSLVVILGALNFPMESLVSLFLTLQNYPFVLPLVLLVISYISYLGSVIIFDKKEF